MQGSGVYYGSTYKSNGHTYIIQSELELHSQFELGSVNTPLAGEANNLKSQSQQEGI